MKIIKIVIKGESGFCSYEQAYKDKVTLTDSSIAYEYTPCYISKSEPNSYRKWSYKTTSPIFKKVFREIVEQTPKYLYNNEDLFATDVGMIEIIVTFEDKHKEKKSYFYPREFFSEYFKLIKILVPETEFTPEVLLTSDDFGDE